MEGQYWPVRSADRLATDPGGPGESILRQLALGAGDAQAIHEAGGEFGRHHGAQLAGTASEGALPVAAPFARARCLAALARLPQVDMAHHRRLAVREAS